MYSIIIFLAFYFLLLYTLDINVIGYNINLLLFFSSFLFMINTLFNSSFAIPQIGLGTYTLHNEEIVESAIKNGYTLIDTASFYGNETTIGNAIKNSKVKREDIFVISKLMPCIDYNSTKKQFQETLKKLQFNYLDLYLIHEPYGNINECWRAIEDLHKEGKIKAIGVSNFFEKKLKQLMTTAEIKPMFNQIEIHPFHQQWEFVDKLFKQDIQPIAWSPFAEGQNDIFSNSILSNIAKKHNKTVAQVILRWFIQRNIIAIPRTSKISRLKENIDIFDFQLTKEDMEQIKLLDTGKSVFGYTAGYED